MHLDRVTVIYFVALIVAIILHEISHGVVALWFGDDTAKRAGRLTLNPVPHIDPVRFGLLPLLGALSGLPVDRVGEAGAGESRPSAQRGAATCCASRSPGPVPTSCSPRSAAIFARARCTTPAGAQQLGDLPLIVLVPFLFAVVNVLLGVFNFLPIPPLDGASLVERCLARDWLPGWQRFQQYGFLCCSCWCSRRTFRRTVFSPFLDHLVRFVFG